VRNVFLSPQLWASLEEIYVTVCMATVRGTTYRRRSGSIIKEEKCSKINRCIEEATLADDVEQVRLMSNLRFNLNCQ